MNEALNEDEIQPLADASLYEIACGECEPGMLVKTEDGHGYRCPSCGYDDMICSDCGARRTFDETMRGFTCGGLELVGWLVCTCGTPAHLSMRSKPADSVDWKLAKSGASIHAGGIKIRAERTEGVEALMKRLVRLPELEAEVERLKALLARRDAPTRLVPANSGVFLSFGGVNAMLTNTNDHDVTVSAKTVSK